MLFTRTAKARTNTQAKIVLDGKIVSVNGKRYAGKELNVLSGSYRIVTVE